MIISQDWPTGEELDALYMLEAAKRVSHFLTIRQSDEGIKLAFSRDLLDAVDPRRAQVIVFSVDDLDTAETFLTGHYNDEANYKPDSQNPENRMRADRERDRLQLLEYDKARAALKAHIS